MPVNPSGSTTNFTGKGTVNPEKLFIPRMDQFDDATHAAFLQIQTYINNLNAPTGGGGGLPVPVPGTPIPVGTDPWGIRINSAGTLAYVCNEGASTLTTIAIPSNTTGTITGMTSNPYNIAIGATEAYVSCVSTTAVFPITLPSTVLTGITVQNSPEGIAITPDGLHVYVCNRSSNNVSVISTASHTVVHTISTPGVVPQGVAITPDGTVAYVTTATNILIISTASNTITGTILSGIDGYGPAITPDGTALYVCDNGGNTVKVIATGSNTVSASITVGNSPLDIAITADGKRGYVANTADNTVTPFLIPANTTGAAIVVGTSPQGIAVTPDGTKAYVTNGGDNTVTPIVFT